MKPSDSLMYEELEFLRESNNIEDVWDDLSLEQSVFAWLFLREQKTISASVIKKTHKILMLHQPLAPDEKGYYRRVPVYIGGREAPHYTTIPHATNKWCEEVMIDILGKRKLWQQRHIEYEHIHPFIDGNGRTGRMFMNWQRLQLNLPILTIKEKEKSEYYLWFKREPTLVSSPDGNLEYV